MAAFINGPFSAAIAMLTTFVKLLGVGYYQSRDEFSFTIFTLNVILI